MKWLELLALIFLVLAVASCGAPSSNAIESQQQQRGTQAIVQNQPVPDLGGYSFERQIVIETYVARNKGTATYTYFMTDYNGLVIELCASRGYPIPYATQITAPEAMLNFSASYYRLPQSEPNSLYSPQSAEATLVQCVNKDGSVSPLYIEQRVFALPYRIKSDKVLQKFDDADPSFKINLGK